MGRDDLRGERVRVQIGYPHCSVMRASSLGEWDHVVDDLAKPPMEGQLDLKLGPQSRAMSVVTTISPCLGSRRCPLLTPL